MEEIQKWIETLHLDISKLGSFPLSSRHQSHCTQGSHHLRMRLDIPSLDHLGSMDLALDETRWCLHFQRSNLVWLHVASVCHQRQGRFCFARAWNLHDFLVPMDCSLLHTHLNISHWWFPAMALMLPSMGTRSRRQTHTLRHDHWKRGVMGRRKRYWWTLNALLLVMRCKDRIRKNYCSKCKPPSRTRRQMQWPAVKTLI